MITRRPLLLGLLALLALLPLLAPGTAGAQRGDTQCFAETAFCISGPILSYWRNNGALQGDYVRASTLFEAWPCRVRWATPFV